MELKRMAQPPRTYSYPIFVDRSDRSLVKLEARLQFIPLTTPLTSTDWDGDARSTTAKTKIDLSEVFDVPAGISAVLAYIYASDSGSAGSEAWFSLSPSSYGVYTLLNILQGVPNGTPRALSGVVPCDSNGDIYFQCVASGVDTLSVLLFIWGYWL
jgi:hypothetical protein